jgi:hypothetical protein
MHFHDMEVDMKLRFSIRGILIATTLLASALYWRTRPAMIAADFESAIGNSQFERADALVVQSKGAAQFAKLSERAERLEMKAVFDEPTINDWLAGRRRGHFTMTAKFDRYVIAQEGSLTATVAGVRVVTQRESRNDRPAFSNLLSERLPSNLK